MEHMDLWGILIFLIYVVVFMVVLYAVVLWDRRNRRIKRPLGDDVKLMRMPGEYLWRQVIEKDTSELQWALGSMVVPVIVAGLVLNVSTYFLGKSWICWVIAAIVFLFVMLWCIARLADRLQDRENRYLGFFGERFVADCLEPLKEKGWFIFHDLQCQGATGKFNIDHVAVGPGGVWIIETKTWRKGRAQPGEKNFELIFDGLNLICPWGKDTNAIKEAADNADWLENKLKELTDRKFDVYRVLTFPGYWVTERKLGTVRVTNPKKLQDVLLGQGKTVLSAEEIKTIRLLLADKCRDVEY